MPRRIVYLVNPAAGQGRTGARWPALRAELERRGLGGDTRLAEDAAQTVGLASDLGRRCDLMVAVGGDGTVMDAATGLASVPSPAPTLALIPTGSGNDTAMLLGIRSPEDALDALAHPVVRTWDAIDVHCSGPDGSARFRRALDFAGTGLAAEVLARTPASWKPFLRAQAAYAAGFFRALASFKPADTQLRVDDWTIEARLAAVVVANQPVSGGGGMRTGPGARPDDGWLNISAIRSLNRGRLALQFVRLIRGTHIHHPAVIYRPGRMVSIESRPGVGVAADGDVLGITPARFEIRPGAVRLVSAGAAGR